MDTCVTETPRIAKLLVTTRLSFTRRREHIAALDKIARKYDRKPYSSPSAARRPHSRPHPPQSRDSSKLRNFDNGGNYVGYFNLDTIDQGSAPSYRAPATVGVEETGDTGGGFDVGFTKEGEWLRYTVNVTQAGIYNLQARVASSGPGGYYHVSFDGQDATGNLFVPQTNAFQTYTTMVSPSFHLQPGQQVMQVTLDGNGPTDSMGNFNWFSVVPPTPSAAFGGTPAPIPGLVQAENFDTGGKGVGYWNGATTNAGGAKYRPGETVSIETSTDTGGGFDVGSTNPGDWLNYSVNIASAGTYTLHVRGASAVGGGVFHLASRWPARHPCHLCPADQRLADLADA